MAFTFTPHWVKWIVGRDLGLHPSHKGSFSVGGGGLCQSVLMLHTVAGSINP